MALCSIARKRLFLVDGVALLYALSSSPLHLPIQPSLKLPTGRLRHRKRESEPVHLRGSATFIRSFTRPAQTLRRRLLSAHSLLHPHPEFRPVFNSNVSIRRFSHLKRFVLQANPVSSSPRRHISLAVAAYGPLQARSQRYIKPSTSAFLSGKPGSTPTALYAISGKQHCQVTHPAQFRDNILGIWPTPRIA